MNMRFTAGMVMIVSACLLIMITVMMSMVIRFIVGCVVRNRLYRILGPAFRRFCQRFGGDRIGLVILAQDWRWVGL